jgi:phage/plasmid-like protein (TIGR03299 family)
MSHEVEKMFFTGKKPWWYGNSWHGEAVGVYLGGEAVDSRTAMRSAGMDWLVRTARSAFYDDTTEAWIEAMGQRFIVRDKDNAVLGRCAEKYVPFQNADAFRFCDSLVREGEMRYHTAGSLKGGAKVWILAQLPGKFQIGRLSGKSNTHYPFLLLIAGHDGISGINLMPTEIRAECANTCGFAEYGAEGRGLHYSVAHTAHAEAKLRIAAAALSEIPRKMVAQQELLQELAKQRMTTDEFIDFATSIFLDVDGTADEVEEVIRKWYEVATPRSKTIMENKVTEVTKLFVNGQGNEGDTAYDAVQAFTEHFDHKEIQEKIAANLSKAQKIARVQGVVNSAWLGAGAKRKALVLKRLRGGGVERVRR